MPLEATPTTTPRQPPAAAALHHRRPIEMSVLPTSRLRPPVLREAVAVLVMVGELVLRQSRVSVQTFRIAGNFQGRKTFTVSEPPAKVSPTKFWVCSTTYTCMMVLHPTKYFSVECSIFTDPRKFPAIWCSTTSECMYYACTFSTAPAVNASAFC